MACISEAYENKYGRSLVKAVVKTFYGKMEDALLSLLFDPIENFARGLKKAFHGMGTDKARAPKFLFFSFSFPGCVRYVHLAFSFLLAFAVVFRNSTPGVCPRTWRSPTVSHNNSKQERPVQEAASCT